MKIGKDRGSHFDGTMDEIRIYNRVLSASEIQQHYQEGAGGEGVIEYNPYFESGNWYKGNVHSHDNGYGQPDWDEDYDGDNTPAEVEGWYRDNGYDFIALTDHNHITTDPGVGGILHIDGTESGWAHIYKPGATRIFFRICDF